MKLKKTISTLLIASMFSLSITASIGTLPCEPVPLGLHPSTIDIT